MSTRSPFEKSSESSPVHVSNPHTFSPFQETGQCDCACALTGVDTFASPSSAISLFPRSAQSSISLPIPLSVWLHLTDRCTLRCAYCYLPHTPADMAPATGRAAMDAVFRSALSHHYEGVKFKYSGGEPLLRFPLLLDLHRYAQSCAKRAGIALDGVILSNGTLLTPEIVRQMQRSGLRLMVSLDGLGAYHDCQRAYAGGRGSFTEVARGIEMALAGGLVPDISITISGRNAPGLPDVVAWMLERELPFSFNFYRANLQPAQPGLQLDEQLVLEKVRAAYKVIERSLPQRSLSTALADHVNLAAPHLRACNVGQHYLVFDTLGRVSKCHMDMAHPLTNYDDPDPLATVRAAPTGLQNPPVDQKPDCQNCEWRYWCAGGCPLQAHFVYGSYRAKSPNCNLYKALLPELVRLESLRLQKFSGQ
ncbi:MAG: SPASM domain-containing protein [Anaerolineae bacterium]|nr:SPASM domain-containing protein [Anaerolineae bacterium]